MLILTICYAFQCKNAVPSDFKAIPDFVLTFQSFSVVNCVVFTIPANVALFLSQKMLVRQLVLNNRSNCSESRHWAKLNLVF